MKGQNFIKKYTHYTVSCISLPATVFFLRDIATQKKEHGYPFQENILDKLETLKIQVMKMISKNRRRFEQAGAELGQAQINCHPQPYWIHFKLAHYSCEWVGVGVWL